MEPASNVHMCCTHQYIIHNSEGWPTEWFDLYPCSSEGRELLIGDKNTGSRISIDGGILDKQEHVLWGFIGHVID